MRRPRRPLVARHVLICFATALYAPLALAQTAPAPAPAPESKPTLSEHRKSNPYQSPLDTIMQTRLWTDVPPAQDFVRQSRPDARSLDYTPLTGKDPDRPKPRDAAGVAALQAELEAGRTTNERRAQGMRGGTASHARKKTAKSAVKKPSVAAE